MMEVVRVSAFTWWPLYHPVNWTFDEVVHMAGSFPLGLTGLGQEEKGPSGPTHAAYRATAALSHSSPAPGALGSGF